MNRQGDSKGFRKAVVFSVAAHAGFLIVLLAAPSLSKSSKKGTIHYIPLNMVSTGGGGGPKPGAHTPVKKETLRDLTIPEKLAKEEPASSLRYPAEKPKTAKKTPAKKAVVSKPDAKAAAETDVKNAGAEAGGEAGGGTGSGIRFGAGGGGGGYGDQIGLANFPFQWYLELLQQKISTEWFKSLIDPGVSGQFQAVVTFRIQKDGKAVNIEIEQTSGIPSLDDSARRAIMKAAPFPALPKEYEQEYLVIHLIFEHSK